MKFVVNDDVFEVHILHMLSANCWLVRKMQIKWLYTSKLMAMQSLTNIMYAHPVSVSQTEKH